MDLFPFISEINLSERGMLLMDSLLLGLTEIAGSYNNRYLTVKVKEV